MTVRISVVGRLSRTRRAALAVVLLGMLTAVPIARSSSPESAAVASRLAVNPHGFTCVGAGAHWQSQGVILTPNSPIKQSGTKYKITGGRVTCAFAKSWVARLSGKKPGGPPNFWIPGGPPGWKCRADMSFLMSRPNAYSGQCANHGDSRQARTGVFSWLPLLK